MVAYKSKIKISHMHSINNFPAWTGTVTTHGTLQRQGARRACFPGNTEDPETPLASNTRVCIIQRTFQLAVATVSINVPSSPLQDIGPFRATSPQPLKILLVGTVQPQRSLHVLLFKASSQRPLTPVGEEGAFWCTCPASCGLQGSQHLWSPSLCGSRSSRVI